MTLPVTAAGIGAGCAVLGVLGKLCMVSIKGAKTWVELTLDAALSKFRGELIEEVEARIKRLPCMSGVVPDTHFQIERKRDERTRAQTPTRPV